MAVLSIQLALSMVAASMLSKLTGKISFARWIFCGGWLARYLAPSEEEVRTIANVPHDKGKNFKHKNKDKSELTVPKSIPLQLDCVPIQTIDILPLHFFTEYQWLVDFSLCGVFVYFLTELYYTMLPSDEFNLSMMWCILVICFCLQVLAKLTKLYFTTEDKSEGVLIIIFGFVFFVAAMCVTITSEETLEFGLASAYSNFSHGALNFLDGHNMTSKVPASFVTMKAFLIILSLLIGAFLTFPGLRLARMHLDALKYAKERPFITLCLHLNMISPLFIIILWVKPFTRNLLVEGKFRNLTISNEMFEALRITAIFCFIIFRFLMLWPHLQAHLNMAVDRIEMMKKEAGRISFKELQKLVLSVFMYLCVVTLQYLTPLILILYLTFILKTMGDVPIAKTFDIHIPILREPLNNTEILKNLAEDTETIKTTALEFSLSLSNFRHIFTAIFFKGVFSYLVWWVLTAWFLTSGFGMIYYSYIDIY